MLTNARSFHFDAHTSQMAFHASSHASSSSGGVNPPLRMTAASFSSIPAGGTMVRTQRRHDRSDAESVTPVVSSISLKSLLSVSACFSFSGLARTCSNVPNGIATDTGRLIQLGIPPFFKASRSAFVLRAFAPTRSSRKSSIETAKSPAKSMALMLIRCASPLCEAPSAEFSLPMFSNAISSNATHSSAVTCNLTAFLFIPENLSKRVGS